MPPEIKLAMDRLRAANADPDATDSSIAAAIGELRRVARETDPDFAARYEGTWRRLLQYFRAGDN